MIEMEANQIRSKLIEVLSDNGIKLNFIAKKLNWNYQNLVNFKNGKRDYSDSRLEELDNFINKLI
jgi:hypothetical protein